MKINRLAKHKVSDNQKNVELQNYNTFNTKTHVIQKSFWDSEVLQRYQCEHHLQLYNYRYHNALT